MGLDTVALAQQINNLASAQLRDAQEIEALAATLPNGEAKTRLQRVARRIVLRSGETTNLALAQLSTLQE